jgi:TolB-like protein/Tfp pilus assembly protein PilF
MSQKRDQEPFADGLSEELLNRLAQVQGLRVTSRSSSFYFRDKNEKPEDIGVILGVSFLLEGSVRKDGEQLRITAQLIDASSGFHLWSQTYDRKLENIFAVQDEISIAITNALREPLGIQLELTPRLVATTSTEAHEAYLRGRYLVRKRTRTAIESAVHEFEKAIALDPDYALAHAELAISIFLQRRGSYGGEFTITETLARAAPHAEQALTLDQTLPEALYAAGRVMQFRGDDSAAREYYRQAIQVNPNYSLAYSSLASNLIANLGRYDEGNALRETALRLDPMSWSAYGSYFLSLVARNRLAEAERHMEKYASIDRPRYAQMQGYLRSAGGQWAHILLGRLESSRIDSERWIPGMSSRRYFATLGLEDEALTIPGHQRHGSRVLRILGRTKDAVTITEANMAEDPMDESIRRMLGLDLAAAGEYERARPILEEVWHKSGGVVTRSTTFPYDMAAALIAIRRDAGEEAGVDELVAALRDNVRRCHEAGITVSSSSLSPDFEAGLADYFSGEHENGIALIAKAAEEGYFILPNEAYLQTLYDDPGFAPIMAGQQARQARERKRFLDVVCKDTRYAEIWQPT